MNCGSCWIALVPDDGVRELDALGLLAHLLPEVKALQGVVQSSRHHLDAYDHSLLAVRYAAEMRDWLRGGPLPEDRALSDLLAPRQDPLRAHFSEEIAARHDRAGWLVWHALFHDTGKPGSRTTAVENGIEQPRYPGHHELSAQIAAHRVAHLRFSRREVLLAERVAAKHGHPNKLLLSLNPHASAISTRAAFRFFRDVGSIRGTHPPVDGLDVILQAISDRQATGLERGDAWRRFVTAMESLLAYAFSRPAGHSATQLVDGHFLMRHLGLQPGPAVGDILRELAEAQAAGEVTNVEEALVLAGELCARMDAKGA